MVHLDATGRLVGDDGELAESKAPLTARQATQHQLEAIEEGFNKLVDVLENVNESVSGQRHIKQQEEEISKRKYYFIPQEKIAEIENEIEDGDLLAFTSTVKGLDVNHVGIAVRLVNG